jgi:hypothetical protein
MVRECINPLAGLRRPAFGGSGVDGFSGKEKGSKVARSGGVNPRGIWREIYHLGNPRFRQGGCRNFSENGREDDFCDFFG